MAKEKNSSDAVDRLMLRFPHGLRQQLAQRAQVNLRSMNSEIIKILADVLGGQGSATTGEGFADTAPAVASNETALQGGPITHG